MAIPDNLTREEYFFMAYLAEKAERHEEMANYMNKLVVTTAEAVPEISMEERNQLTVAYKNVVTPLRAAIRVISAVETKEEGRKNDDLVTLVRDYRSKVLTELSGVCESILNLLDEILLPSASENESKVYYWKMKGDYHRYLAEFKVGDERRIAADETMHAYQNAQDIAVTELPPTHSTRLSLALNFSVFYFEILDDSDTACSVAKQAFDDAVQDLDLLSEESYKDCTLIMQLVRDNLILWSSNTQVVTSLIRTNLTNRRRS